MRSGGTQSYDSVQEMWEMCTIIAPEAQGDDNAALFVCTGTVTGAVTGTVESSAFCRLNPAARNTRPSMLWASAFYSSAAAASSYAHGKLT